MTITKNLRPRSMRLRTAYSLVELVVVLPVMVMLTAGLYTSIYLASHSVPSPDSSFEKKREAAKALERFERDLFCALEIRFWKSHVIIVVVPDRNGDGDPEYIGYGWPGDPGDPLYRGINDEKPEVLLSQVQDFALSYRTRLSDDSQPQQLLQWIDVHLRTGPGSLVKQNISVPFLNEPVLE